MKNIRVKLTSLIDRFRELSTKPFSAKREHDIDDVFAELMRVGFDSGKKEYKDEDHPKTRTRAFSYRCDDKKHHLLVKVVIVKGKSGESQFTIEEKF